MTVSEQIEALVGTYPYAESLEYFFDRATRQVFSDLPEHVLNNLAAEEPDSGTGVDVTNKRVLRAHKDGYPVEWLDPTLRTRLEAVSYGKPGAYELANKVYVVPEGGTVVTLAYPDFNRADSEGDLSIPDMLLDVIVTKTAINVLAAMMKDIRDGYGTAVTLPTAPTPPNAPSFAAADITAAVPTATPIAALPSAPVYNAPSLDSKPTAPTISALDLTTKVDGSTALTPPSAPASPALSYSDATAAVIGTVSVGELPALPTYTAATFGGSLSIPSLPVLDLSTELDNTTPLNPPAAPSAPTFTYTDASVSSVVATTIAALATAPTYTKDTSTLDFTAYDTYEGDEDPEMMSGIVNKLNVRLTEIRTEIEDEVNEWRAQSREYDADTQHKIEQARIKMQEALANARMGTDTDSINQAKELEAAIATFDRTVANHGQQLATYRLEIERQVQTFNLNYEKTFRPWAEQQRMYLEQYARDIQKNGDAFRGAMEDHQLEAQRIIEQARVDAERVARQAQLTTDVAVQNEAQTVAAALQNYARELELFGAKSSLYNLEAQLVITKYGEVLDRALRLFEADSSVGVQRYSALLQNARNDFEGTLAVYRTVAERDRLQAQITAQEAAQTAQLSQDAAIRNQAKAIELAFKDYDSQLALFQAQLANFEAQSQNALNKQRTLTESASAKLRMMSFDLQRLKSDYQEAFGSFIRQQWRPRSFVVKQHPI